MDAKTPQSQSAPSTDEPWDDLLGALEYEEPPEEVAPQHSGAFGGFMEKVACFRKRKPKEAQPVTASEPTEQPSAPAKPTKRRRAGGFTRQQKIILGVLGMLVLLVYAVILTTMLKSMRAKPAPGGQTLTVVSPVSTPINWTGHPTATTTASATESVSVTLTPPPDDEGSAAVTPTPTQTPTPLPELAVATQYDAQVLEAPNDISLRLKRGNEYLRLQAYKAAEGDFEHVLSLDKQNAEAYVGLGQVYLHTHRWQEAESAFGTAIAFQENLDAAHFNLGYEYYLEGRYEEAAKEFDWTAELRYPAASQVTAARPEKDPAYVAYVTAESWLAISSARQGQAEAAMEAISRTVALSATQATGGLPKVPLAYVGRAWAFQAQDPPALDQAQGDLLYAKGIDPYNFEVLNALARFYATYRHERLTEAEQLAQYALDWARDDLQRARALHTMGLVYLAEGRKDAAQQVFSEASNLVTSDGKIAYAELAQDAEKAIAP